MGYLDNNAKAPEFLSQMILKVFTTTTWNSATIAGHSVGQKQFIIRFIHGDIIESRPSEPFAALEQNFLWNQSSNWSLAIYIHTLHAWISYRWDKIFEDDNALPNCSSMHIPLSLAADVSSSVTFIDFIMIEMTLVGLYATLLLLLFPTFKCRHIIILHVAYVNKHYCCPKFESFFRHFWSQRNGFCGILTKVFGFVEVILFSESWYLVSKYQKTL